MKFIVHLNIYIYSTFNTVSPKKILKPNWFSQLSSEFGIASMKEDFGHMITIRKHNINRLMQVRKYNKFQALTCINGR